MVNKLITVGNVRAEQIVAHRQMHGPYKSLMDLTNIEGIKEKWVQSLIAKNQDGFS